MAQLNVIIVDVAEIKLGRQLLTDIKNPEGLNHLLIAARVGSLTGIYKRLQGFLHR